MKVENCPNCGAVITEEKCPYCGTTIFDFSSIDLDNPCYIKLKHGDKIIRFYVKPQGFVCESDPCSSVVYADDREFYSMSSHGDTIISLNFKVIPHKNEVFNRDDVLSEIIDMNDVSSDTTAW